jgi:polyisoprenoid-binding protein YceI
MKVTFALLLAAACLNAQQIHIQLDRSQTKIGFTLGDVLHTVHGTFQLTEGNISVDPATGKAAGRLIVSANSGDSGSHARDSRMTNTVLQAAEFPQISFMPDRIDGKLNLTGDSAFQLHGAFGLHGGTHELTMAVKSHIEAGRVTASARFDVPYVDWGLKDPSTLFLKVNHIVQIEVNAAGATE